MIQRLMTYDGGQPVYASDLAFMQDAFQKTVNELCRGFGDTYILYGAADESRTNCIAGAVVISGEIYSIPSELGAIGQNMLCFRHADSDERTFYDASQKKVKRTCEAYLSTDTSGAVAYIDLKTAVRINQAFNDAMAYLPRTYVSGEGEATNSRTSSNLDYPLPDMTVGPDDTVIFSAEVFPDDVETYRRCLVSGTVRSGQEIAVELLDGVKMVSVSSGNLKISSAETDGGGYMGNGGTAICTVIKNRQ